MQCSVSGHYKGLHPLAGHFLELVGSVAASIMIQSQPFLLNNSLTIFSPFQHGKNMDNMENFVV